MRYLIIDKSIVIGERSVSCWGFVACWILFCTIKEKINSLLGVFFESGCASGSLNV